ncbi:MAG: prolyl oligopeptidase family serine peptidase [Alphaproteobacteria bacterium]|nr:prolyl oligopeptidase family serine peptidase [Alphaproteobacteria bacterium]
MRYAALSCLFSAAVAATSNAASLSPSPDLTPPWPDISELAPIDGVRITFPSHSPFSIADVGDGPDNDPATSAVGTLFLPPNATPKTPLPAIVLLHGAAGVLSSREMTYGRQFASMGVAALVVDVFAARRDWANGFIDRLMNITEAMILADAYSALEYLATRNDIDSTRIALIGFSYGGMATTYAAFEQVAERYMTNGLRFAGHVAFYAPCIASFEDNRSTGAPLLMLFGAKDAIVDRTRCQSVADALRDGGGNVQMVIYDDAYHQWDGRFAGPRKIGRNLAECDLIVERDGTVRDRDLLLPMTNSFTRKIILALCADDEGYLIGRNDDVRARSNGELADFLHRAFALDRRESLR